VRIAVFAIPAGAGVLAALLTGRSLPAPPVSGVAGRALTLGAIAVASIVAAAIFERLAKKLVPLSILLRLSLAFPDKAPSRVSVARKAGRVRDLRRWLAAQQGATNGDATHAASTLLTLLTALGSHDKGTRGHAERVRVFVDMLAEEMDIPPADRDRLRWAALLHDIGKLTVPSDILNKPGRLSSEEWDIVKRHPTEGMRVAGALLAWLGPWSETIEHHHEWYEGSGYPNGISGHDISLGGRIVSVADAFDTITSPRPYKKALSASRARVEVAGGAGKQFDPVVVRAFLNVSLGRLWRTVGLASWLASLPFLPARAAATGHHLGHLGAGAARAAAMATAGIVTVLIIPALPPAPFASASALPLTAGAVQASGEIPGGIGASDHVTGNPPSAATPAGSGFPGAHRPSAGNPARAATLGTSAGFALGDTPAAPLGPIPVTMATGSGLRDVLARLAVISSPLPTPAPVPSVATMVAGALASVLPVPIVAVPTPTVTSTVRSGLGVTLTTSPLP
jgi:putative nucleotidyltransferase with HDIG domain